MCTVETLLQQTTNRKWYGLQSNGNSDDLEWHSGFSVIHLLCAFSNAIFRTAVVQQCVRFRLT